MNLPKKNYYLDTSVLSPISFIGLAEKPTDVIARYGSYLDQMELYHPRFAETDFTLVTTPALFLEIIGLGQDRMELKHLVNPKDWESFVSSDHIDGTGGFCDEIAKRVRSFILDMWPGAKLYRRATVDFLRKYKTHAHAHFLSARIKRWAKNLRKPAHYNAFAKAIFLDTMFRYPFINLKTIAPKDRLKAMQLWAGVLGRLSRVYFDLRGMGFEYSAMGLFAEIHRVGGLFNSPIPDEQRYDILMRTWDDMADSDSINYALLGRKKQPVNLITMDRKSDVERRLSCLAQNLKHLSSSGFQTEFHPGTVTIFSESLQVTDFFLVKDVI
jgi:hypothetical protein